MNDIFDYINKYGSKTFYEKEPNDVDALILCQLSYLPFDDVVTRSLRSPTTVARAAYGFFEIGDFSRIIWKKTDARLLAACAESKRFKDLRLSGYVNELDDDEAKQFSAIIFKLKKRLRFLAFRGTDHSFAGWEEDFNLYSRPTLPSQKRAAEYLGKAARLLRSDFIIGGHSKGGNLAMYAYENIAPELRSRIKAVYNFDGPSLNKEPESDKIRKFVPQSAIFGTMLSKGEDYSIVKCKNGKFNQHDVTSWLVDGDDFDCVFKRSQISRRAENALSDFVNDLDADERRDFIDTLFGVFRDTGKQDFDEVMKKPTAVARSFIKQDKANRRVLRKAFGKVMKSAGKNIFKVKKKSKKIKKQTR